MDSDQLELTVNTVSRVHPVSIVINLLFIGILLSGVYGLLFDNKAFTGVAIYIGTGFVVRSIIIVFLKIYLRSKYSKLLQNDSEA